MKWMKFECKYLKNYISANFTFWYLQGGFLGIKNAIYSTYMYTPSQKLAHTKLWLTK